MRLSNNQSFLAINIFNCIVLLASLILSGCGQNYEKVEIDVSNSIKEAIKEAAPESEYRFFALKESIPKNIEDINRRKLFVCGDVANQVTKKVYMAWRGDPDSIWIQRFFINPRIISGELSAREVLNMTTSGEKGSEKVITILIDKSIYGKDHSIDSVVNNCLQEMRKHNSGTLLIKKGDETKEINQMVEIKFI